MVISATRHHCTCIGDDLVGSKECAVHPPTSLLHQHRQTQWTIGESLGVGDVLHRVSRVLLNVDLEAHDSVLGEILVRFRAFRSLLPRHILEKLVQGRSLDCLPSEDTVGTWQHRGEAEERLTSFVWRVA